MRTRRYVYLDQAGDGTNGSAAAAAPAGAAAPPAAGQPPPAAGAAGDGTGSVLSQGAAGQPAGNDFIPEKYRVTKPDGTLDIEASARKVADAHTALEKRLGTTELPPKSAEEYAPKVEVEGFNWDEFKGDPKMQGFLKGAHAKGINNEQLSFVLGEYAHILPEVMGANTEISAEQAVTELRQTWKTDQDFNANVNGAFKAFSAFADPGDRDKIDSIGNNPIVLRLLANIGKEMREDTAINEGSPAAQGWEEEVAKIRADPAYTNTDHPEHKGLITRMNQLYEKRYGSKPQSLGGVRTFQT